LENLFRYDARPPVATERLSLLPDGRVLYHLRHHWRDGTTHMVFEPLELVGKLAALVPPPMFNLVRYSGIFAPAARWRPFIVPFDPEATNSFHHSDCVMGEQLVHPGSSQKPRRCHPRNYSWAELMRRVFEVDVLVCDHCGGRMRILAAIHSTEAIRGILECLGLPSRAPPISPALSDEENLLK
jgi:Putative transposase